MDLLRATTKIEIADVVPATSPLPEANFFDAVAAYLQTQNERGKRPEACCSIAGTLVTHVQSHPFVTALHLAFAEHRPLRLTPDAIWLLIGQGVAQHVDLHAESCRSRFVTHQGQETVEVRVPGDMILPGSPENPWPEVVSLFCHALRQRLGDAADVFTPHFSTTGPWERTAFEVILMKSMEKYFRYKLGRVICGIPCLTIDGRLEDWLEIRARLDRLSALLDLDWWLRPLRTIIDRFVSAKRGKIDRPFWRSIYRWYQPDEPCSPGSQLGWFAFLFPYLEKDKRPQPNPWLSGERHPNQMWLEAAPSSRFPWRTRQRRRAAAPSDHGVFHSALPTGVQCVPFSIVDLQPNGQEEPHSEKELVAGFVGIGQDARTLELCPQIGWAVRALGNASVTKSGRVR